MKYSLLGFKQDILVEQYTELNASDIIVLRTMVDMLNRLPRTIEVENKIYIQMTYDMLISDLPFITNSTSTIKKIVQKFIDKGLIERHLIKKGGNFTYFRTTDALDALQYVVEKPKKEGVQNTAEVVTTDAVITTEEQLMEAINLGRSEIRSLADEHGALELMKARNYVLEKYHNGTRILNPIAYLRTVLINKYYISSFNKISW